LQSRCQSYEDKGIGQEIVCDIMLNSAFTAEEVERERGVVLQEISRYDEPESVAYHAASEVSGPIRPWAARS
jgi:predicted Zn-dependent peptidase